MIRLGEAPLAPQTAAAARPCGGAQRNMNYGRAIKTVRALRGLSQKDLAEQLGVKPSYISMIEGGEREPGRVFLESLSMALNVPLYLLMLLATDDGDHRGLTAKDADELSQKLLAILVPPQGKTK